MSVLTDLIDFSADGGLCNLETQEEQLCATEYTEGGRSATERTDEVP